MNGQQQRYFFQAGISQTGVPLQVPPGQMQWFGLPFMPQQMAGMPMMAPVPAMPQPGIPNSPNTVTITEVSSTPTPSRAPASNQFITAAFPTNSVSSPATPAGPSTSSTLPVHPGFPDNTPGCSMDVAVPKKIKCIFCSCKVSAPDLLSHLYYHVDYKPFLCKHCGNKFVCIEFLQNHAMENNHLPLDYAKVEDRQLSRVCDLVAGFCQQASETDKVGSLRTLAEVIAAEVMKLPRPPAVFSDVPGMEWVSSLSTDNANVGGKPSSRSIPIPAPTQAQSLEGSTSAPGVAPMASCIRPQFPASMMGQQNGMMILTSPHAMSLPGPGTGFVGTSAPAPVVDPRHRTAAAGDRSVAGGTDASCRVCGVQAPFATLSRLEHLCKHLSEVGLPPLYYCMVCGVDGNKLYDLLMHRVSVRHRIGSNFEKLRIYIEARWPEVYGGPAPTSLAEMAKVPTELLPKWSSPIADPAQPRPLPGPNAPEPPQIEKPPIPCALCGDAIPGNMKDMVAHLRRVHASSEVDLQWLFACAQCNLSTDTAQEMIAHMTAKKTHKCYAKFQDIWDSVVERYFDVCFPGQTPDRTLLRNWKQDARAVANARANGAVLGAIANDSDSDAPMQNSPPPQLSVMESSGEDSVEKEAQASAGRKAYPIRCVRCSLCNADVHDSCGKKQNHIWTMHMPNSIVCTVCNEDMYSTRRAQLHNKKFHGGVAYLQDNRDALKPDFDVCLEQCFANAESSDGPPTKKRGRKSTPRNTQPTASNDASATASREPSPPRPQRKRARHRSRSPSRHVSPTGDVEMVYSEPTITVKTESAPENDANDNSPEGTRTSGSTVADSIDLFQGSKVFCELDDSNVESDEDFESVQLTAAGPTAVLPPKRQERTPAPTRNSRMYICAKCASSVESRDVKFHVLFHVHEAGTPAFMCRHCPFSSHKALLVEEHCKEFHPGKAFRLSSINNVPEAMKHFYLLKTTCFPDAPDSAAVARGRAAQEYVPKPVLHAADVDSSDSEADATSAAVGQSIIRRKRPRRSPTSRSDGVDLDSNAIQSAHTSTRSARMRARAKTSAEPDADSSDSEASTGGPVLESPSVASLKRVNIVLPKIDQLANLSSSAKVALKGSLIGKMACLKCEEIVASVGHCRRMHVRQHINTEIIAIYKCNLCGFSTHVLKGSSTRRDGLIAHLKDEHGVQTDAYQEHMTENSQEAEEHYPDMWQACFGPGRSETLDESAESDASPAAVRKSDVEGQETTSKQLATRAEARSGSMKIEGTSTSPTKADRSQQYAKFLTCRKCQKAVKALPGQMRRRHVLSHIDREVVPILKCKYCEFSTHAVGEGLVEHFRVVHDIYNRSCPTVSYRGHIIDNTKEAETHYPEFLEACFGSGSKELDTSPARKNDHPIAHPVPEKSSVEVPVSNTPGKQNNCQKCGKMVQGDRNQLKQHALTHINSDIIKVYECRECGFSTVTCKGDKGIISHCRTVHGNRSIAKNFAKHVVNNRQKAQAHVDKYLQQCFPGVAQVATPAKGDKEAVTEKQRRSVRSSTQADVRPMNRDSGKGSVSETGKEVSDANLIGCHKCDTIIELKKFGRTLRSHVLFHINAEVIGVYECLMCSFSTVSAQKMDSHIRKHLGHFSSKDRSKYVRNNRKDAESHIDRYFAECFPDVQSGRDSVDGSRGSSDSTPVPGSSAEQNNGSVTPVCEEFSEVPSDAQTTKAKWFACQKCGATFSSKQGTKRKAHLLCHINDEVVAVYQCLQCPFTSGRLRVVEIHCANVHDVVVGGTTRDKFIGNNMTAAKRHLGRYYRECFPESQGRWVSAGSDGQPLLTQRKVVRQSASGAASKTSSDAGESDVDDDVMASIVLNDIIDQVDPIDPMDISSANENKASPRKADGEVARKKPRRSVRSSTQGDGRPMDADIRHGLFVQDGKKGRVGKQASRAPSAGSQGGMNRTGMVACRMCGAMAHRRVLRHHALQHINDEAIAVYECLKCSFTGGQLTAVDKHCANVHGVIVGGHNRHEFVRNNLKAAEKHIDRYLRECFPHSNQGGRIPQAAVASGGQPLLRRRRSTNQQAVGATSASSDAGESDVDDDVIVSIVLNEIIDQLDPIDPWDIFSVNGNKASPRKADREVARKKPRRSVRSSTHRGRSVLTRKKAASQSALGATSKTSSNDGESDVDDDIIASNVLNDIIDQLDPTEPMDVSSASEIESMESDRTNSALSEESVQSEESRIEYVSRSTRGAVSKSKIDQSASVASCTVCGKTTPLCSVGSHAASHMNGNYVCMICYFHGSKRGTMKRHLKKSHARGYSKESAYKNLGDGMSLQEAIAACFPDSPAAAPIPGKSKDKVVPEFRKELLDSNVDDSDMEEEEAVDQSTSSAGAARSGASKRNVDQSAKCAVCDDAVPEAITDAHAATHVKDGYGCRQCSAEFGVRKDTEKHLMGEHGLTAVRNNFYAYAFKQLGVDTSTADAIAVCFPPRKSSDERMGADESAPSCGKIDQSAEVTCALCNGVVPSENSDEHAAGHAKDGYYGCRKCPYESGRPEMVAHIIEKHGMISADINLTTRYAWMQLGTRVSQEQALAACFPALQHNVAERSVAYVRKRAAHAKYETGVDQNGASLGYRSTETSRRSSVSSNHTLEVEDQSSAGEVPGVSRKCEKCGEIISSNSVLIKSHILSHVNDEVPVYLCTECDFRTHKRGLAKIHVKEAHPGVSIGGAIVNNTSEAMEYFSRYQSICFPTMKSKAQAVVAERRASKVEAPSRRESIEIDRGTSSAVIGSTSATASTDAIGCECALCGDKVTSADFNDLEATLSEHALKHISEVDIWSCTDCALRTTSREILIEHSRIHSSKDKGILQKPVKALPSDMDWGLVSCFGSTVCRVDAWTSENLTCDICQMRVKSEDVQSHVTMHCHYHTPFYACKRCDVTFFESGDCRKHTIDVCGFAGRSGYIPQKEKSLQMYDYYLDRCFGDQVTLSELTRLHSDMLKAAATPSKSAAIGSTETRPTKAPVPVTSSGKSDPADAEGTRKITSFFIPDKDAMDTDTNDTMPKSIAVRNSELYAPATPEGEDYVPDDPNPSTSGVAPEPSLDHSTTPGSSASGAEALEAARENSSDQIICKICGISLAQGHGKRDHIWAHVALSHPGFSRAVCRVCDAKVSSEDAIHDHFGDHPDDELSFSLDDSLDAANWFKEEEDRCF